MGFGMFGFLKANRADPTMYTEVLLDRLKYNFFLEKIQVGANENLQVFVYRVLLGGPACNGN